ncbi:DUF1877 family protein [Promicromonospora aerolata]|uniref:DUF1877 family protein n=1 Tax=Promicromonospora aerolata TaxID=195749 RepID=A0ABW4V0X5_9MICO
MMNSELCLVEVSGSEMTGGIDVLEPIFAAVRDGVSERLSCGFGNSWPTLNLFLTGEQYATSPPLGHAVLGGAIIELSEPMQLLVLLESREAVTVRDELNQVTFEQLLVRNGERVVGQFEDSYPDDAMRELAEAVPGRVLASMREGLSALQEFYGGVRVEKGFCVAKRLYGHL